MVQISQGYTIFCLSIRKAAFGPNLVKAIAIFYFSIRKAASGLNFANKYLAIFYFSIRKAAFGSSFAKAIAIFYFISKKMPLVQILQGYIAIFYFSIRKAAVDSCGNAFVFPADKIKLLMRSIRRTVKFEARDQLSGKV